MNDKHDNRPVRRDDNLPVLVSGGGPEHDQVPAEAFPAWSTIAGQQHIRAAVVAPGGELWLATTGGMLRWSADLLSYSRYGSEHGLPGNAMHRVAVDGSGQVWVISASGALYFLDGARWRAYGALCHTPLTGLSLDLARGLWVTGSEGVWRVDSERKAPWAVPDPPDMTHRVSAPHALAVGRADDIWLASTRGLFHYDGVTWKGPREFVGILSLVREGASLWLGTAHGLRRIDLDRGELVTRPEWPAGPTAALCPAPGGVWAAIGTTTGRATATSWRSVRGKLQSRVTALAPARPDDVWIATQSGLWRGSSGGVEPQATAAAPDAIQSAGMGGQVTALGTGVQALVTQQDASGTLLWIGTSRGAFRFNTSSGLWRSWTQPGCADVRALAIGANGRGVWAASWDGGLQELPARVLKLAVPRAILSLSNDPTGGCWAAACLPGEPDWAGSLGEPDGIYQNHGGDWSLAVAGDTLRAAGMPMDARVQVAAPAGDGSLWIGTSHGLWRYTSGVPKEQMGDAGRADVRALLVLAPHELLVGACRGLFVGRTGVMAPVAGLEQDVVVALARDAVGETVWAATAAGLVHLERTGDGWAIRRRFTADSSGLASDHVTSLALEVSGEKTRVWIGTAGGLCCYVHQRGGS